MQRCQPLRVGNKVFPVNLIQGPLAGYSCAPFRLLTWRYSQPAFSYTEMISSKALLQQPKLAQRRYIKKDPNEGPVCFQLAANDPNELAEATKKAVDYGADLIDLNCGCPVNKVRRNGAGSSLLADPSKLYQLIRAMKQNTDLPVSIKIRVDGMSTDKNNQEIAKAVGDAGADFLVVHGRHWTDNYGVTPYFEQIQFFVENLKIPVIGNGDIACAESLNKMLNTGCAGVMICRAGVGQPWLIKKLIANLNQESYTAPSLQEAGAVFIEHVERLAELLESEKIAVVQSRKFAKYYARGLPKRAEFNMEVNTCSDFNSLKSICMRYAFI